MQSNKQLEEHRQILSFFLGIFAPIIEIENALTEEQESNSIFYYEFIDVWDNPIIDLIEELSEIWPEHNWERNLLSDIYSIRGVFQCYCSEISLELYDWQSSNIGGYQKHKDEWRNRFTPAQIKEAETLKSFLQQEKPKIIIKRIIDKFNRGHLSKSYFNEKDLDISFIIPYQKFRDAIEEAEEYLKAAPAPPSQQTGSPEQQSEEEPETERKKSNNKRWMALEILHKQPGLTKAEIAKRAGCSKAYLSKDKIFCAAFESQKEQNLPRGYKNSQTGDMDAWDD
ncbi:hypothetical protein [Sedimentisphaera salicampi]|uniref:hypothetical protein n=1 Tax=Sedimentisphaera salicampi TaxID=1941349 RepID=UPI000B9B42D6|nr:hypothetical protein [Sedimentisphaera salicampi]OXU15405.1 hypothetical protein SMSP1_00886 [Sedimentisphaera salicampi]